MLILGGLFALVAIMGSVVAIISGFLSTFQFQKKWIEYRTTSETLKHEKYLFEMDLELLGVLA